MCSHVPFFGTNKNLILKTDRVDRPLGFQMKKACPVAFRKCVVFIAWVNSMALKKYAGQFPNCTIMQGDSLTAQSCKAIL